MFYGIVVSLYFYDNKQHNLPHIHVGNLLLMDNNLTK